jgi:hypothetical protein
MDAAESAIASVTEVRITSDLQVPLRCKVQWSVLGHMLCEHHVSVPRGVTVVSGHAGRQGIHFYFQRSYREAKRHGRARALTTVSGTALGCTLLS